MKRVGAVLGSAIFLAIAPGTVAVYVPWKICHWHFAPPLLGLSSLRVIGAIMILAGPAVLLDSFARFAFQGLGAPAPTAPTQHLVVTGLYRHVRNPMYVAVLALILGQGLLFGNVAVFEYGFIVWLMFLGFVVLYEEPTLRRQFGTQYEEYCIRVPRWIPHIRPK